MARNTKNSTKNDKGKNKKSAGNGKKGRIAWNSDNVEQEDGTMGKSSYEVCIDWLSSANNYSRWRGDDIGGATKKTLASQVVQLLKEQGITHRTAKDVFQKLGNIQSKYTETARWLKRTGQGIKDEDPINGINTVKGM